MVLFKIVKYCIFISLFSVSISSACLVVDKKIPTIWFQKHLNSPTLSKNIFSIDVAIKTEQCSVNKAVFMHGVSFLPGKYGNRYGGRIPGATKVIAINKNSGVTYQASVERHRSAPLSPQPDNAQQSSTAVLLNVKNYFNLNIGQQLQLPLDGSQYLIFAWIDEFVSPLRRFTSPNNSNQHGHVPNKNKKIIKLKKSPASVTSSSKPITLTQCQMEKKPALCIEMTKAVSTEISPILLFQRCEITRKTSTLTLGLPNKNKKNTAQFYLPLSKLTGCDKQSSYYLLINNGSEISSPLFIK